MSRDSSEVWLQCYLILFEDINDNESKRILDF